MNTPDYFDGVAPIGFPVYWYPNGIMNESAEPYVAFVIKGWTRGVCDLQVLPSSDGSVLERAQVFHGGDPRLRDSYGRLSPGATERGCWVPVPWVTLPETQKKKAVVAK